MPDGKIEKIQGVTEKVKLTPEERIPKAAHADKAQFDALMEQGTSSQPELHPAQAVAKPSLLEEAAKAGGRVDELSRPSMDRLVSEAKEALGRTQGEVEKASQLIESAREKLDRPELGLKDSYERQMRNRLTHVEESLKIAVSKSGAEVSEIGPSAAAQEAVRPLARFLSQLSHAQDQLEGLGSYLEGLQASDRELAPQNMLAIQMKVHHIQQELEFFTNMLNKALESTKALMNVQV